MELVDGWAPDVPMGLVGPFLESMRFGEWLPGHPFRCQSLLGLLMAGTAVETAIIAEDAMEQESMDSRTLFRPTGRDGAWRPTEPRT